MFTLHCCTRNDHTRIATYVYSTCRHVVGCIWNKYKIRAVFALHLGHPDPNITLIASQLSIVPLPSFANHAAYHIRTGTVMKMQRGNTCVEGWRKGQVYSLGGQWCVIEGGLKMRLRSKHTWIHMYMRNVYNQYLL